MMKNIFSWLSFQRDKHFVRNIVIAIGVVLVWRGVWHLADMYLFPNNPLLSNIVSLIVGILILYLPDGSLHHLWWYNEGIEAEKSKKLLIKETIIFGSIVVLLGIIIALLALS